MGEGLEERLGPRRGSCSYFQHSLVHMTELNTGGTVAVQLSRTFNTNSRNSTVEVQIKTLNLAVLISFLED